MNKPKFKLIRHSVGLTPASDSLIMSLQAAAAVWVPRPAEPDGGRLDRPELSGLKWDPAAVSVSRWSLPECVSAGIMAGMQCRYLSFTTSFSMIYCRLIAVERNQCGVGVNAAGGRKRPRHCNLSHALTQTLNY